MIRTVFSLLLFAGSVSASVQYKDRPFASREEWSIILPPKSDPDETLLEYNDDTIVILDGKKTKMDKVIPENTEIIKIELARDGRTILRVEFKTKGKK